VFGDSQKLIEERLVIISGKKTHGTTLYVLRKFRIGKLY
jgi:hypothetical protein